MNTHKRMHASTYSRTNAEKHTNVIRIEWKLEIYYWNPYTLYICIFSLAYTHRSVLFFIKNCWIRRAFPSNLVFFSLLFFFCSIFSFFSFYTFVYTGSSNEDNIFRGWKRKNKKIKIPHGVPFFFFLLFLIAPFFLFFSSISLSFLILPPPSTHRSLHSYSDTFGFWFSKAISLDVEE